MNISSLITYLRICFPRLPIEHWAAIIVLSSVITVLFNIRNSTSISSFISFGATVFITLFLLDATIGIRLSGERLHNPCIDIYAEYLRLVHGNKGHRFLLLFNLVAFIPFGFFLYIFVNSSWSVNLRQRLKCIFYSTLGFSFSIEFFQMILRIGYFELTDLVLNTIGGLVGAFSAIMALAICSCVNGQLTLPISALRREQ